MFDLMTDGRGEESDDGEGDSNKLHDIREKVNVLNSDLQELFDLGEDCVGEGEGEIEGISINEETTHLRLKRKQTKWGKLQNLDLIPNTYIYHETQSPKFNQDLCVPSVDDFKIAQDSIFN
jgi:hypothetical protein